ncbi:MAG: hypothetical protein E6G85_05635 [Alphaproteobacteria bacterium]|nr:MAG: hypothetical protein E6G85_05635 [Alphaproteobacteria bacterium]
MMSLFHVRHVRQDDRNGATDAGRWPFARMLARLAVAFKIVHRAIVAAKLRRLRSELLCHGGYLCEQPDRDAEKFPRPPLILDDKWDF